MLEVLASIGLVGIIILVIGFVALFWLAKVVDEINDQGEDDD